MAGMTHGIGWFQIGTDQPDAAKRFYSTVFGWTFALQEDENVPYHVITTPAKDSIRGGLLETGGRSPNHAIFCVVVEDVAATCVSVAEAGGKVVVPPNDGQDGLIFAHVTDPSGNELAVYSPPKGQAA
jgi:predicted enzyme related to lactoylglutathione lyase